VTIWVGVAVWSGGGILGVNEAGTGAGELQPTKNVINNKRETHLVIIEDE
jgi:hypothetical protein